MKKTLVISLLFILCESIYSQQVVPCPQCYGYGTVMTYAGPMYCPTCGGAGRVVVNPPQNQTSTGKGEVNFQGKSHGDATPPNSSKDGYIYQGRSVKVNGIYYKLYKKNGREYIYDRVDGWCRLD